MRPFRIAGSDPDGPMKVPRALAAASLIAAVCGCSSPASPAKSQRPPPYEPAPTVTVTNPLCDAGGCDTLVVSMWVWSYLQYAPGNPPLGAFLGLVTHRTGCIQIPGLDSLKVGVQDSTETPRNVHTYYWRPDNPQGIFLNTGIYAGRETIADSKTFVPADALSWNLTFTPDVDSASASFTAHLTADSVACTPSS